MFANAIYNVARTNKTRCLPLIKGNQKGTSLIEVMVSLLILGVGLLGMLSLQANGLNGNQRANFVTDAQIVAQDMAGRIQASASTASSSIAADAVRAGGYNGIDLKKADNLATGVCDPNAAAGCGSAAAITYNQNEWLQVIKDSSLPSGRGIISWSSPVYTIQVMWDEDRDGTAPTCTIDQCFQMEVRI